MRRRRRTAREIARRSSGAHVRQAQLWFLVGMTVLTIVALLAFRRSCGERVATFYEIMTRPAVVRDGGLEGQRPGDRRGSHQKK